MGCCGQPLGFKVDTAAGGKWIRCLSAGLGVTATKWTKEAHAAAYAAAETVRAALEASYPLLKGFRDPGYGLDPLKVTQLVSVLVTEVPAVRSSFWSCMGITETEAEASLRARSGAYHASLMSALAMIYNTETGDHAAVASTDGGLALGLLALGSAACIYSVSVKKRRR